MTKVLITCTRCEADVNIDMAAAILRMDVEPRADSELLFSCPACGRPGMQRIAGELLTKLLFVGVQPLRLSEPSLPAEDRAPALPELTRDDLLTWHEQLETVWTTTPWER